MDKDNGRVGFAETGSSSLHSPEPVPVSAHSGDDPARETLKVWWVPQMPMKAFEVMVPDLATAAAILDVLADYDAFQFENRVKGDYSNAGGLLVRRNGEWEDWEDPITLAEFDEWRDENLPRIRTNGWGKPLSDTDGSPKGGNSEGGSVRSTTAGAEGIAHPAPESPQ